LKKKKKKKKTFDLDGAMEGQTENTTDNVEVAEDNKEVAEKEEEDLDLESFGKKKKKKKKVVEFEAEEKGAEDAGEKEVAEEGIVLMSFNVTPQFGHDN
jgi:translation initiation factor 2 subunit 2